MAKQIKFADLEEGKCFYEPDSADGTWCMKTPRFYSFGEKKYYNFVTCNWDDPDEGATCNYPDWIDPETFVEEITNA